MAFEELVADASSSSFQGWDFSVLRERAPISRPLPWRYPAVVAEIAADAEWMLDMGTGGGEALLRIPRRARKTIADEAYPPNVPVAAANLRPHGIPVVQVEGAADNVDQEDMGRDGADTVLGRMPYADRVFDCVANRHESFFASEVCRVLRPGGRFVTQQVDFHTYDDFYAALELQPASWLPLAEAQLADAGFEMLVAQRGEEHQTFKDVGALVWYLRSVSWAIPGFDPDGHEAALRRIHAHMKEGPLTIRQRRFLVVARRP